MNLTMIIILVASAIVSYVVGGVNGAIIFSKLVYHEDIREKGSGNPGFTNFKRVYGLHFITWVVLFTDFAKTALPVLATALLLGNFCAGPDEFRMMFQFGAAFSGLFCMLGHCFPVWYGFKGGKAFIAGFATTWFVDWRMALIALVIFFAVLAIFKYMSVASCTASLVCPIALFILGPLSMPAWVLCLVSALLVIVRHSSNFKKLANGTESKFTLKKNK